MTNDTPEKLTPSLEKNLEMLKKITGETADLLINPITICGIPSAVICFEGMTSGFDAQQMVILPLMRIKSPINKPSELYSHVKSKMILSVDTGEEQSLDPVIRRLMSGFAVLMINGITTALCFGIQGYEKRSIDEPGTEGNIYGSHEGFVETVRTNMSLIRRRIKSPDLQFKLFPIAKKSNTDVIVCFMADRVPSALVKSVVKKLENIELETILGTGYVRPFLDSKTPSVFTGISMTERPDVMCSKLLEGRVGVLIEGTPFALVLPTLFAENFQTLDDYNFRPFYAVFLRYIRYIAFFVAVFFPGLYVGTALFHPDMISPELLYNLAAAEEAAPLHLMLEALIILVFYEIIREAGVRLPKAVGGAVSIVGGLIIGDSAVNAGIISNPVLLVCAIAVTASFVLPSLDQQITVFRFAALIAGGLGGLFGIAILSAVLLSNICAAECYGLPVMSPFSPFSSIAMGDTAVRLSFRKMGKRGFTVEKLKGNNISETSQKELHSQTDPKEQDHE